MKSLILIPFLISSNPFFTLQYDQKSYTIESKVINGVTYFNLAHFQTPVGFQVKHKPLTKRFTLKYEDKQASLIPDNPWLILDSIVVNLPIPPKLKEGTIWSSLPLLNELLEYFLNVNLRIEEKKLLLYEVKRTIKKVVIDPGHGGKDPGAIGPNGVREKDIVLEIAKLTAELLQLELGITCVLTRDKDIFTPLRNRTIIANKEKADLFLSIHCNAHRSRKKTGSEVFFLSPAKTDWARAVEARENASIKYETQEQREEIESILWDLAQTEFLRESNALSGKLVNSICHAARTYNKGVKQANFYVLHGVYMPACLLEIEFISNPESEKKLKTKKFQQKFAKGIVRGVKKFKEWYEKQLNP